MPDKDGLKGTLMEWFSYGERDLQSVKILLKEGGHTGPIAMLLQQAAEKYLKGYLLGKGWKLRKTHDLEFLMAEAAVYDKTFEWFLDLARALSAFYLADRYPPGLPRDFPRTEIDEMLAQTEKLVARIKELTAM